MRKFSSLSRELEDKTSPIYSYVRENFPNTAALARLYRQGASDLLVPTIQPIDNARSSTIGEAFDLLARFVADPKHYPKQALQPLIGENLLQHGEDAAYTMEEINLTSIEGLPQVAAAVCWYLALTTQAYRSGGIRADSPLAPFIDDCDPRDLISLATEADIEELQKLHHVAQTSLYPLFLGATRESLALGPEFAGSSYCRADADIIVGGTLVEIKTRVGRRDKNGNYADALRPEDARAVLGYILFDLEDDYRLQNVAFYSARYGRLFQISVPDFLEVLAGRPVDLAQARVEMKNILEQ